MTEEERVRGQAGGVARAELLPADKKKEIARKGALARWGAKATHRGSFKEEFGIDVDCYVLDDDQKTAVVSQRGMGEALGLGSSSGSRLPTFMNGKRMAPYIGRELREKLENPLVFQGLAAGANSLAKPRVNGYDVTILVDICHAVVAAESANQRINPAVVRQAHVILGASAKAGIKGLVYALAGYDATREEVIAAFKFYVREEARDYEREFPEQLYEQWYRLYQIPRPERSRPWKFQHLTRDQVYKPLAKSNGKVLQLTQAQRAQSGEHYKKLHQFLSDIGVKALRNQLGQLLGIARISRDRMEYERHFETLFGEQPDLFDASR